MALLRAHNFEKDTVLKNPLQKILYECCGNPPNSMLVPGYGIISDSTIVAGADALLRHIKDARKYISITERNTVNIVEIDENEHFKQLGKFRKLQEMVRPEQWVSLKRDATSRVYEHYRMCPLTLNVTFQNCDIAEATVTRFIDADLMGTYLTTGVSLIKTLVRQKQTFSAEKDKTKCFLFTMSIRFTGEDDTLKWLVSDLIPIIGEAKINPLAKRSLTIYSESKRSDGGFKGVNVKKYTDIKIYNSKKTGAVFEGMDLYSYNDDAGPMVTGILAYK